jgi:putative ABC transport system ATP-binding protein
MDMLAQIHRDGQTVLLVTHDAKLAASYASRVLTMRDGRIVDDALLSSPEAQAASDLLRLRNEEAM